MNSPRHPVSALLLCGLLLLIPDAPAHAGSAAWNLDPVSNDWNTAANWTPATVPDSPAATATFGVSNQTSVSNLGNVDVDGISFNPGASGFTIAVEVVLGINSGANLTFDGTGVTNNSGTTQNFVTTDSIQQGSSATIDFTGSATAGANTVFTNNGASSNVTGGLGTTFLNNSTADHATFVNNGSGFGLGGNTEFFDLATAADGTFINAGDVFSSGQGGFTEFHDNSSAGNGAFTNDGTGYWPGHVLFVDNATAENAVFTNEEGDRGPGGYITFAGTSTAGNGIFTNAGSDHNAGRGQVYFHESSHAGTGTFTLEGGSRSGSLIEFDDQSSGGNSTIIAKKGAGANAGATIQFFDDSTGGASRLEVFGKRGSATLDISGHNLPGVTVGSIEGDGLVLLGTNNLGVGANNLSTTFSGLIQDFRSGNSGGVAEQSWRGQSDLNECEYVHGRDDC